MNLTDNPMVVTREEAVLAVIPATGWLFGRARIAEYLGISARLVTDWVASKKLRVKWVNEHFYMAKPTTLDEDVEKISALYEHHKAEKQKKDKQKQIKEEKGRY